MVRQTSQDGKGWGHRRGKCLKNLDLVQGTVAAVKIAVKTGSTPTPWETGPQTMV